MHLKYGLNGYQLKLIAAVLMLIDHIHYFFDFTGLVPVFFTQLGRLSAPVFLFLLVEGFFHTKNRLKYFLQVYILAAAMVVIRGLIAFYGFYVPQQGVPINGILSTFAVLIAAMQGFEWLKVPYKRLTGAALCAAVLLLPFVLEKPLQLLREDGSAFYYALEAIFPMHTVVPDGGTLIIICGLALYFFRKHRVLQAIAFIVAGNSFYFAQVYFYVSDITVQKLLYPYCQWMMMFAALFFLLYNNKRGEGRLPKSFFYIFYPAHIYILSAASYIVYILYFSY